MKNGKKIGVNIVIMVLTKHETLHCFLSSGGRNRKEVKIKIKYSLKP